MDPDINNTYDIPGMEDMEKDEYLAALNERTMNMQRARRQSGAAPRAGRCAALRLIG